MEKASSNQKLRNKILKLLPKAVAFRNLPFSPRREARPDANAQRFKTHHNKAFSGPIISMIPAEARRKPKNFETQEPTSPKVSCMGQVKHNNKISSKKHVSLPKELKPVAVRNDRAGPSNKKSAIKKILRGRRKSAESAGRADPVESAPALSQMRRFASSRDTFANFDWTTAQIAPEEDSDDEVGYSDGEEDDGAGDRFAAAVLVRGGGGLDLQPKKEINIWKRRTMAQPKSLQLNL